MAKKPNDIFRKLTSPAAQAIYPYLSTPDTGKFAPTGGQFKVSIRLPAGDPFVAALDAEADRCFAIIQDELSADPKTKKKVATLKRGVPYKIETDDEGDPTGTVLVTVKRKVLGKDKRTGEVTRATIPLFDGAGNKLPAGVDVWGGSTVRVSINTFPYHVEGQQLAGVSLRLGAVQVLELVTRGGGRASDFGFETDGDALDVEVSAAAPEQANETTEEGAGNGVDF